VNISANEQGLAKNWYLKSVSLELLLNKGKKFIVDSAA